MKRLLISAAMFAAIGGTAFAQTSNAGAMAPDAAHAAGGVNNISAPTPPIPQVGPMDSVPAAPIGPMAAHAAAAPPMAAPDNATDTSAAVPAPSAMAASAPPTHYPVCKTRSQDHCRVSRRR
jgi:hypothetical protein